MPYKICDCGAKSGVRSKKCGSCGESFEKPMVGTWPIHYNNDRKRKDLPEIEPPAPLPSGKLTNKEIRDRLTYDGIDIINGLIHPNKIKDKKLSKLWSDARKSIQQIIQYVYNT